MKVAGANIVVKVKRLEEKMSTMKKTEDFKIFEDGNVKEVLARMLKEGYVPLNLKAVWNLREVGRIRRQSLYDTRTIFHNGEIREATIKELQNIKEAYDDGIRVLFVGGDFSVSLFGYGNLGSSARFVGVKGEK